MRVLPQQPYCTAKTPVLPQQLYCRNTRTVKIVPQVARTLYAEALERFPSREAIWRAAAQLEMGHGSPEQAEDLLRRAVKYCPQVGLR